jgi:hypothetical protein
MRPVIGLSRIVTVGMPAALLLFAAAIALPAFGRLLVQSADSYDDLSWVIRWHGIVAFLVLCSSAVAVPIVAGCLVIWLYRSRRNLAVMPEARPHWGWEWTLVGWLVPIVLPFVVTEVTRESGTGRRLSEFLAWGWFVSLVAGLATSATVRDAISPASWQAGSVNVHFLTATSLDDNARAQFLSLFPGPPLPAELLSLALLATATALAVALVRVVTTAQRRRVG